MLIESLENRVMLTAAADIVFVVDESRSMDQNDYDWLASLVCRSPLVFGSCDSNSLEGVLTAHGIGSDNLATGDDAINQYGLLGFGGVAGINPVPIDAGMGLMGSAQEFVSATQELGTTSGQGVCLCRSSSGPSGRLCRLGFCPDHSG